ncbi:MAG: hypothetical protein J0L92_36560 [Deltaproteobacteria bacterium]|nr:hypothetical protein [Deltaproteobacteria bacterium]
MTDERAFFQRLDASVPQLPRRVRAAWAAAAAERGLGPLAESGGLPIEWLERAVELTWSFALGHEVPFDLHRAVRHHVEELRDERADDLLATEDTLGAAIEHAIALLDPEADRRSLSWCLERAIEAAETPDARAWLLESLERAMALDETTLERSAFGPADPDALAREARVRAWREAHVLVPWREATGIPRRLEVLEIGTAPPSSQGIVSVPGHRLYGVFERGSDRPGFSVPDAIAYGMTPDERSGVARGDYDWYLERHAWPERAFEARHVVQARDVIAWCSPVRLEVPIEGNGRIAMLRARSEDALEHVFVVDTPDGTRETRDRNEALQWAIERWKAP